MKRPAVFLDRDGVLNRALVRDGKPYPPADLDELEILPDVPEALTRLAAAGFARIVVSNQPDVARGTMTAERVSAINDYLADRLAIDKFMVCFDDGETSYNRKPRPGMLFEAARLLDIDLARSFMVGDRWRDIEAGIAAGCRTVFIDRSYAEKQPVAYDFRATSLSDAVDWILNLSTRE